MEKIPEEALLWAMGVSATVQVRPESGERKTRAAGPPVPKKISSPESARQVLLAANAPSLGRAAGMLPLGERIPMFAVRGPQQEKFAIDRIAEREAVRFREAGDGVQKELLA